MNADLIFEIYGLFQVTFIMKFPGHDDGYVLSPMVFEHFISFCYFFRGLKSCYGNRTRSCWADEKDKFR